MSKQDPDRNRKSVGVYDRPAGADRSRGRLMWIAVAVSIAAAIGWYFYLT